MFGQDLFVDDHFCSKVNDITWPLKLYGNTASGLVPANRFNYAKLVPKNSVEGISPPPIALIWSGFFFTPLTHEESCSSLDD